MGYAAILHYLRGAGLCEKFIMLGLVSLLHAVMLRRAFLTRLAYLDGDTDCVQVHFVKARRVAFNRCVTLLPHILDNRLHLQEHAL